MSVEEEAKKFVADYYGKRYGCPECGCPISRDTNKPVEVDVTGYDGNRAICPGCKWEGVIHELVPKGQSKNELAQGAK